MKKYITFLPRKLFELILSIIFIVMHTIYSILYISVQVILAFASFIIYGYNGVKIFYKFIQVNENVRPK
jgi:hypothetical protein